MARVGLSKLQSVMPNPCVRVAPADSDRGRFAWSFRVSQTMTRHRCRPLQRGARTWATGFALFGVLLAVLLWVRPGFAGDPRRVWRTIETSSARVHYHADIEVVAQRVASYIDEINGHLSREVGWELTQPLEIVLTDGTDSANGSATGFPFNTMRLNVTAPDDMSALGDYDNWYLGLITHEHTHILQMDCITGAPAIINALIGRRLSPNQAQPRWLLEGLAVFHESRFSTGGRLRSSMFDMWLRADVLDDRLMRIDQMFNGPRRWPRGHVWYLYGSHFFRWIAETYGYDVLPAIVRDTSADLIPYGINRHIRRVTGRTYEQLYPAWQQSLRESVARQMEQVHRRGLREGTRLTHLGYTAGYPRFVPPVAQSRGGFAELVYYSATGHRRSGHYRVVLDAPTKVRPGSEELIVRAGGTTNATFLPDGSMIYNTVVPWRNNYWFHDLQYIGPKQTDVGGIWKRPKRLTHGRRVHGPDVSPDGESIVYTRDSKGTRTLMIASLGPDHQVTGARVLVPSAPFEQAFTPRFSPDGALVAYSAWTTGGYRDIRIVDVETGQFRNLMKDRAIDMHPVFSPDGEYLLFTSDRTGIANVYAYHMPTGKMHQVTNVRTGAYHPELSPDGTTLIYVGYTSYGYDLWAMPFDPSRFLEPEPYEPERGEGQIHVTQRRWESKPYNPLPTLRPRALEIDYAPGTYGKALSITTRGADAVGNHSLALTVNFETSKLIPYAGLHYGYYRLPFDYHSHVFTHVAPRLGPVIRDKPTRWDARTIAWTNGIQFHEPHEFEHQTYGFSYSIAQTTGDIPVGRDMDPYAPVRHEPLRGNVGVFRASWFYSNVEQFAMGVGAENGLWLSAFVDVADTYTGSDYSVYAFGYGIAGYVGLPWMQHHSLALHLGGAISWSNYPGQGLYYVGGFMETKLRDIINQTMFQGAFVLRGYEPGTFAGSQYHLANAEYRFPIATIDRGLATLPMYLSNLSGNLFVDYGGAFETLNMDDFTEPFHTGIGAELFANIQFGYQGSALVRLGYAKGFGDLAIPGGQWYLVASSPF